MYCAGCIDADGRDVAPLRATNFTPRRTKKRSPDYANFIAATLNIAIILLALDI